MENEKRLIDADSLMERFLIVAQSGGPVVVHVSDICAAIEDEVYETTVEAVPVVHGRWKYYHRQNIAVCTNCSFERNLDDNFGKAISCPNCGAKMDGDGNG